MAALCSVAPAEGLASISPKWFQCHHSVSPLWPCHFHSSVAESAVDMCRVSGLPPQGRKDARFGEEEKMRQTGQRASTARCRLQKGTPPHHPLAPTSLSRRHWLRLERENLPLSRYAGSLPASVLPAPSSAHPLAALSLALLHRNYARAVSPTGCDAQQLCRGTGKGSLLPGAAELTSKPDPQLPPRP